MYERTSAMNCGAVSAFPVDPRAREREAADLRLRTRCDRDRRVELVVHGSHCRRAATSADHRLRPSSVSVSFTTESESYVSASSPLATAIDEIRPGDRARRSCCSVADREAARVETLTSPFAAVTCDALATFWIVVLFSGWNGLPRELPVSDARNSPRACPSQ